MRRPLAHIATAAVATAAVATAAVLALAGGCTAPAPTPDPERTTLPYWDATLPVPDRVADLLARMDLADKVGQMTQAERSVVSPRDVTDLRLGSVLSGGGSAPPDNTPAGWADMVDGLQQGAAATPLGIPLLYGVDAVHGNQSLYGATIYPHNIGLGAAGDPDLVQRIARATAVEMAATGVNWTFAPCVAVVQDTRWGRSYESFGSDPALGSAMVSFSSWNGQKMHGNRYLITDLLKGELGFEGFVVSDWAGIDQLDGAKGFSQDEVVQAINAGVDMVMVPNDPQLLIELLTGAVEADLVPMDRIDDAVGRILTVKIQLGLFEAGPTDRSLAAQVGSDEHRALAREAVAASLVVLANDGVLPLAADARVLVAGSNADDIGNQSGGWTLTWQGLSGDVLPGTTILEGLQEAGLGAVTYSPDGSGAQGDDVAIAVVGETPYAEFTGDRPGGVFLSAQDDAVLDRLRESGVPTVLVVVSGRPMDISDQLWVDAAVAAWLPGSEGAGVADVLTGQVAPSGKLPVVWGAFGVGHGLEYE